MTVITCKSCHCAPPAAEGLCIVCLRDRLQADRERRHAQVRRRRHRDVDEGKQKSGPGEQASQPRPV